MSSITLSANAAGSAIFTVAAPNTNTNRTITLPDATSTLATTADVAVVAAAAGGMTLLGTLATTSGTTVTLSGLDLTSYKFVVAAFKTVSVTIDAGVGLRGNGTAAGINIAPVTGGNANGINGILQINLITGVYSSVMSTVAIATPAWAVSIPYAGNQTVVGTATTSIGFDVGGGTFDAGSITIYGVK